MSDLKIDINKVSNEIIKKLKKVTKNEILDSPDSCPMVFNILKLLEIYEEGNFYGIFSIKTLGTSSRNMKIQEQSLKLVEEKSDFILDN